MIGCAPTIKINIRFTPFYFVLYSVCTIFAVEITDWKERDGQMARHNEIGKWGEEVAADYLRRKGYVIRERDWRSGRRDIDIIAVTPDGITVVFVEVKTRSTDDVASPEDAVDGAKIRNLCHAADDYVKMHNVVEELRFDIVSVVGTNGGAVEVEHMEDAFNPLLIF